ncbi:hypothetical protein [Streptomyces xiamenensis]|uniref:hypothetical protein n=1 Tax=Streptomyces xiamenensis TaxID=408015 RepID=UPI0037CFB7D0
MTAVDGRDALAIVIIRPGVPGGPDVSIEANANGLSKEQAAHVLRHVADLWDPAGAAGEIQWAVRVDNGDKEPTLDVRDGQDDAVAALGRWRHSHPHAQLVQRTAHYGPWQIAEEQH